MSDVERIALLLLTLCPYCLLCWYCWRSYQLKQNPDNGLNNQAADNVRPDFLVAYASQGGNAHSLAKQSAALLDGQVNYQIMALNQVSHEVLAYTRQALFVVSTYGDGEPPDNASTFAARYLKDKQVPDLSHLQFSVVALGDKLYQHFCAFGHQLHQGLSQLGAVPLFAPLEVCATEGYDAPLVLNNWHQQWREGNKAFNTDVPEIRQVVKTTADAVDKLHAERQTEAWYLDSRKHLNPGSPGAAMFHLRLLPLHMRSLSWQAGDVIEITLNPDADNRLHQPIKRKYSIASLPQDGAIELIVRQHINPDGRQGLCSGWLTAGAPLHSHVSIRLCDNPAFQAPLPECPMILIGSGTGIAGLRAHIKQREHLQAHHNWLIYGERSPQHDKVFAQEISAWQQSGVLQQMDWAFSRDPKNPLYVQDVITQQDEQLRQWINQGAVIYLCGSLSGMARSVDQALRSVLGQDDYQQLVTQGRYRRDIY